MTYVLLIMWILSGLLILQEWTVFRQIIFLGAFSLITTIIFLFQGAPDVALASASVSGFSTIFLVVCFEKYYGSKHHATKAKEHVRFKPKLVLQGLAALVFCGVMLAMFVHFAPNVEPSTYLKHQYATHFRVDVGGENAVTAIYLAYRLYDTVFEALMLVVSVIAVVHLSFFDVDYVSDGRKSDIRHSATAINTIRFVCPILLLFGIYLVANGHLSPGGGFQGGVAVAVFFVCRFMIFNIYDLPVVEVLKDEKIVFLGIILVSVLVIFMGIHQHFPYQHAPLLQNVYLLIMNALIGTKVALGFLMLFYRYVAIDRR